MKSVVELWVVCLTEAGNLCHVRTHRDAAYAAARIEEEGLAFLTITLPRFEKDMLNALSLGRVESNHFTGFRRRGGLPLFMGGFLSQIFDAKGLVRPDVDPTLIKSVRQVLLLLSKVELPVSQRRSNYVIASYVETDKKLVAMSDRLRRTFRSTARVLLNEYLSAVESRIYNRDWAPRHATGALATRETANGRYNNATWTERLQEVVPWWDDLTTFPSEIEQSEVTVLAGHEEEPCRLTLVPKTMKGPRVIVMEPVYNQYVQQGILHVMTEVLSERRFRHLANAFSWKSQEPNRWLAALGSVDGSFATIDLSEASDRVTLEHVEDLLDSVPYLRSVVMSCRSRVVKLEDGRTHRLNKFASMGSSLCFPMESMVFFIILSIAQAESNAIAPSRLPHSRKFGELRIYGDDIIVPERVAQNALYWLQAYGLKVNEDKTFTTGHFRESCGADWFQGRDVTAFKMRASFPTKHHHYRALEKTIEFHNRAYGAGWFLVAEFLEKLLDKEYPRIPRVPVGLDTPAIWSWEGPYTTRSSPTLHRPEYKTLVFREVKPEDRLDGYGALKKCLSVATAMPQQIDHLERGGRSRCVGINNGWMVDTR